VRGLFNIENPYALTPTLSPRERKFVGFDDVFPPK
jgi:hypothetical protein